jgi:hypothetical protein
MRQRAGLVLLFLVACLAGVSCLGAAEALARGRSGRARASQRREWPFAHWAYARAYTFNFVPAGPGYMRQIYTPQAGMNPKIRSEHVLSAAQARVAAKVVSAIEGTQETSKCPFPRHGLVFFDSEDKPVGAISICFTREDIVAWPDYEIPAGRKRALVPLARVLRAFRQFESLFVALGDPVFHDDAELMSFLERPTIGRDDPSLVDRRLRSSFHGRIRQECWLKPIPDAGYADNPCVLTADLDGDKTPDTALLVVETKAPKRRGIAVLRANGVDVLLGAGISLGNGGDDFSWMDAWKTIPAADAKELWTGKHALSGDALLLEETGSASGLVGWASGRFHWQQASD